MNLHESIKTLGLPKVLKSLYPTLIGVNFNEVRHHTSFDQSGFEKPEGKNHWSFAIGNLPLLYIVCDDSEFRQRLEHLLLVNGIDKLNALQPPNSDEITFWQGDNFKIEKVQSKEGEHILIVTQDVSEKPVDSTIFNSTELASKLSSVSWILGVNPIYSDSSIADNNKSLGNFNLCPIHFVDDEDEYILIPLKVYEYAKPIIEYIIRSNGGFEVFNSQQVDGWEFAHLGHLFAIGFLPEVSCIRINRIEVDSSSVSIDKIKGIHPKSETVNSIVLGLNQLIYGEGEGAKPDGRLLGVGPEASNIFGFHSDANQFIKTFKQVVLRFNPADEFIQMSSSSIGMWLDKNPEETIAFNVEDSFDLILSKGESFYRLNILPSNASTGWNENPEPNQESNPTVIFSKPIELAQIPKPKVQANLNEEAAETKDDQSKEKQTFIQNSLDDKLEDHRGSKNNKSYLRWIWGVLTLVLLLLLLRNCEFNPDSRYYYERGLNKYDSGKIEKAEKDFERAINLDNSYSDAYQARGELYLESGRYQEALYDFDQLIRIDEKSWYAYYLRGLTHMKLANSQYSEYNAKAISDFSKSIELNSTSINGRSYYQRASVFKSIGDERSCEDFYTACDFEIFDACEIVDSECRPQTGSLPYENIFGPGVYTGKGQYSYTNNCEKDAVVTLKSLRTKRAVRSVFIRSGDKYVIDNIPKGSYRISILYGDEWLNKTNDRGRFNVDERAEVIDRIITYTGRAEKQGLQDCVIGGSVSGSNISIDEYFNR